MFTEIDNMTLAKIKVCDLLLYCYYNKPKCDGGTRTVQ